MLQLAGCHPMGNTSRWGGSSKMRVSSISMGKIGLVLKQVFITKERRMLNRKSMGSEQNKQNTKQIYLRNGSFIFSM